MVRARQRTPDPYGPIVDFTGSTNSSCILMWARHASKWPMQQDERAFQWSLCLNDGPGDGLTTHYGPEEWTLSQGLELPLTHGLWFINLVAQVVSVSVRCATIVQAARASVRVACAPRDVLQGIASCTSCHPECCELSAQLNYVWAPRRTCHRVTERSPMRSFVWNRRLESLVAQ